MLLPALQNLRQHLHRPFHFIPFVLKVKKSIQITQQTLASSLPKWLCRRRAGKTYPTARVVLVLARTKLNPCPKRSGGQRGRRQVHKGRPRRQRAKSSFGFSSLLQNKSKKQIDRRTRQSDNKTRKATTRHTQRPPLPRSCLLASGDAPAVQASSLAVAEGEV